jgi:purine nucleoside permease
MSLILGKSPDNFSTEYIPLGAYAPDQYPENIYGTEVFEVNEKLRDFAVAFADTAELNDTATAKAYRALYTPVAAYAAGSKPPSVVACDVATSDVCKYITSCEIAGF